MSGYEEDPRSQPAFERLRMRDEIETLRMRDEIDRRRMLDFERHRMRDKNLYANGINFEDTNPYSRHDRPDPWISYPISLEPVQHRMAHEPPRPHDTPLAQLLSTSNGRFIWMRQNNHYLSYYVHDKECIRYHLMPQSSRNTESKTSTLVSKQWVLKEVLELFQYEFKEHLDAFFAIDQDLAFVSLSPLHYRKQTIDLKMSH